LNLEEQHLYNPSVSTAFRATMASKKQQSEEWKNKGNAEYSKGNNEEAIKLYSKAIECDPSNHVLYSNRSAAYFALYQWNKALEDAEKCISAKPDWGKGYFRKGSVLVELKRYPEAVDVYKMGLKMDPSNTDLKTKLNEAEDLKRTYRPKVNPDGTPMSPIDMLKEEGNDNFRNGKIEKAIECYTKVINQSSDVQLKATVLCNRAACQTQLYNHDQVVADCSESLNLVPGNLKALIRRGLAYEALEKMEKALDDFRAVLLVDPNVDVANKASHRISSALRKEKNKF